MRTRSEVARLVEKQLEDHTRKAPHKKDGFHYGRCELWELLDFIYGGSPLSDDEYITGPNSQRLRNARAAAWRD